MSMHTPQPKGLSSSQAEARLKEFGPNEIDDSRLSHFLRDALKILSDPMGLMLLSLSALYFFTGKSTDALILLFAYIPIVTIDVVLELRSQKALRLLKQSMSSECFVMRDEKLTRIHSRDLVPGDLLILEEGQNILGDGLIIDSASLTINEASVTGESIPVEKNISDRVLSGTQVLTGRASVLVEKTGLSSQIGSIARVLKEFQSEQSPLLKTIHKTIRWAFLTALVIGVLLFLLELSRGTSIAQSLIAAATLTMAAIPEEFPLVFTLYLSVAAYRLSRKGILVKSLPAVEGLGRINVFCTDKTGTLTLGKFQLKDIVLPDSEKINPRLLYRALLFSCEQKATDAMEAAIFDWIRETQSPEFITTLHSEWILKSDYPFCTKDKYLSHVWKNSAGDQEIICMKGSIEGVLKRCKANADTAAFIKRAEKEAGTGHRILALAAREGTFSGPREDDEKNLKFLALLVFSDPLRHTVKDSIKKIQEIGVEVKMLTGDHLATAHAIADSLELKHAFDQLYNGPDIEKLSPEARAAAYRKGVIFARLSPIQKLEMTEALKNAGLVVAMTGDGINDAPALKKADVSISMGAQATDIARSTAQMILVKNQFHGIVEAIAEGRRVFHNLEKCFSYLIAFHIPIILIAIIQALFFKNAILLPIHIILLELVVHPVSAFSFDTKLQGVPELKKSFLSRSALLFAVMRGLAFTALCLCWHALSHRYPESVSNSAAVIMLVIGNIGLILAEFPLNPKKLSSNVKISILLLSLMTLALSYFSPLQTLFSLETMPFKTWLAIFASGLVLALLKKPAV